MFQSLVIREFVVLQALPGEGFRLFPVRFHVVFHEVVVDMHMIGTRRVVFDEAIPEPDLLVLVLYGLRYFVEGQPAIAGIGSEPLIDLPQETRGLALPLGFLVGVSQSPIAAGDVGQLRNHLPVGRNLVFPAAHETVNSRQSPMAGVTRRVAFQDSLVVRDRLVEGPAFSLQLSQAQVPPGGAGIQLDRLLVLGLLRVALGDLAQQIVEYCAVRIRTDTLFVFLAQLVLVFSETDDLPVRFGELRVVFDRSPEKFQLSIGVIVPIERDGLLIEIAGRFRIGSGRDGAGSGDDAKRAAENLDQSHGRPPSQSVAPVLGRREPAHGSTQDSTNELRA